MLKREAVLAQARARLETQSSFGETLQELKRTIGRGVAPVAAGMILAVSAGCGDSRANVMFAPGPPWHVAKHRDALGQLWAAGSIPLCTRGNGSATLIRITAVATHGQIRLDRIAVRKVHEYDGVSKYKPRTTVIGTYPGVPPGSREPDGYVVRSNCRFRHVTDPFYEAVVVAARTGANGGWIEGLRVDYSNGPSRGSYVIPFTFALCGRRPGDGPCS